MGSRVSDALGRHGNLPSRVLGFDNAEMIDRERHCMGSMC